MLPWSRFRLGTFIVSSVNQRVNEEYCEVSYRCSAKWCHLINWPASERLYVISSKPTLLYYHHFCHHLSRPLLPRLAYLPMLFILLLDCTATEEKITCTYETILQIMAQIGVNSTSMGLVKIATIFPDSDANRQSTTSPI